MQVITAGNEFYPKSSEGRTLGFLIAVFGYSILGNFTATFDSYFIAHDAKEKDSPVAGLQKIKALKSEIIELRKTMENTKSIDATAKL
jgi:voltage-gated potassium channel